MVSDPFPPYIIEERTKDAEISGIYVDLVRDIFSRIDGVSLNIEIQPWKRCLEEAREGNRTDGILMLFKTPEREAYLDYTDPVLIDRMRFWYSIEKHPGGIRWKTLDDLKPYVIGIHKGYSITPEIDQAVQENRLTVEWVRKDELNLAKLAGARIDLVPITEAVGYQMVKETRLENKVVPTEQIISESVYYVAFSKKAGKSHLIPKINQALKAIKTETAGAGSIDHTPQ